MLRISKLTDYGTVVLASIASCDDRVCSAAEVARKTGIAVPTVSKLLKLLGRAELVKSTRGANGGYQLARPAHEISASDVIDALEGPVSITECSSAHSHCDFESFCNVGGSWQRINIAIRRALDDVSLIDLLNTNSTVRQFEFAGLPVTVKNATQRDA